MVETRASSQRKQGEQPKFPSTTSSVISQIFHQPYETNKFGEDALGNIFLKGGYVTPPTSIHVGNQPIPPQSIPNSPHKKTMS